MNKHILVLFFKRSNELNIHNIPPPSKKFDLIGPADKKSNLRPVVFHVPHNETSLQCRYRQMRKKTHEWNQAFWADHNEKFFKVKCIVLSTINSFFLKCSCQNFL